jgi:MFS family permease
MSVEPLDAAAAQDHLEMVNRILAESQQRLYSGGEHFVVWGVGSAYITVLVQLVLVGLLPRAAAWSIPIVIAACAAFSIVRGRQTCRVLQRSSLLQREFFNVLWLTLGLAFLVDVAVFNIFPGMASAAIWSVAEAIVLLYIGMHGNRRAQIAGGLVIVSLVVANFASPGIAGYVLGAGMLVGYAGFGASELLARE